MIRALGLAVADLGTPRVLAVMLRAIAISMLVFVVIAGVLAWLLTGVDPCDLVGISSCPLGAGTGVIGAITLTLLAAWFVFPAVAITVLTTFTDSIAAAVEERHYPEAARRASRVGIGRGLLIGLKSAGRLLLLNVIALPSYLLLLVTGVGPFVLFVIVNGVAFGRDVAELAAARHGNKVSRREWLKSTRGQQHLIGLVVSVLFLVPFANILAPVIGTAAGIHLFNRSFWRMNLDKRELGPGSRRPRINAGA
ncbi:MAG TPA: EI24 domain-containing protein [Sphingomicrobium sp.]|nr:EI24 domain-containing protein [Sphingomicrobium sp.]